MDTNETSRSAPEVLYVPPPVGPVIRPVYIVILSVCIAAVAPLLLWRGRDPVLAGIIAAIALGMSIFLAFVLSSKNRSYAERRRAFLARYPLDESEPRTAALARLWKKPSSVPKLEAIRAVLDSASSAPPTQAVIVCMGDPDVPEVGELHFEPRIITPTGAIWKRLGWLIAGAVALAILLGGYLGWLPGLFRGIRRAPGGLFYALGMATVVLCTWIWRTTIRPTYIRLAPGIIQILEYRYSKSKPTIRAYPMDAGTLAVFARTEQFTRLTLVRSEQSDMLELSRMQDSKRWIEHVWQALLSTAPTPPLSDEDLVG